MLFRMVNLKAVKAQQLKTWAKGDFAMIARNTVFPGELLCEALGLRAGQKVLDVATGSGNAALSASRRGCETTGIDYVPALVERARERAAAERLPARFEVADCEALPFPDESFDVVLSLYGTMFAPDQEKAAQELTRVCRRGGRIGLSNWTPDGFWGRTFGLMAKYLPPAEGIRPPSQWGTENRLNELFGRDCSSINVAVRSALFRYRSSAHWIEVFGGCFGPIMFALETLNAGSREAFLAELNDTLNLFNRSGDDTLMVSADYLEVVMTRKAG
jgi:SAM-dependent methyltransferase